MKENAAEESREPSTDFRSTSPGPYIIALLCRGSQSFAPSGWQLTGLGAGGRGPGGSNENLQLSPTYDRWGSGEADLPPAAIPDRWRRGRQQEPAPRPPTLACLSTSLHLSCQQGAPGLPSQEAQEEQPPMDVLGGLLRPPAGNRTLSWDGKG